MVLSPQFEKFSRMLVKKHGLRFPLLRDEGNRVAAECGLTFRLPDDLAALYAEFGIDLPRHNGNDAGVLPMPARFVLDPEGIVVAAEANPDYTRRPEPAEIVEILQRMAA